MSEEIIRLRDVWVYLGGIPVLEGVDLSVGRGDFLAVIGPNGGGKTTLLKVILGLLEPRGGEVRVFGKKPCESRGLIGYLPQQRSFNPSFPISVFDVVLMGRYRGLFKKYSGEDREAVIESLEAVGMLSLRDREIGSLSGGELQRVFLARAIVRDPSLLLLDEPMSGIDPDLQRSFYELLQELNKRMAIVLVTHDIAAVSTYVDTIACLNRRLFYHGPTEGGLGRLEDAYKCPIEILAHGTPHRVLREHDQ